MEEGEKRGGKEDRDQEDGREKGQGQRRRERDKGARPGQALDQPAVIITGYEPVVIQGLARPSQHLHHNWLWLWL